MKEAVEALKNTQDLEKRQEILDELQKYITEYQKENSFSAGMFNLDDVQKAIAEEQKNLEELEKTWKESGKKMIGGREESAVNRNIEKLEKELEVQRIAQMSKEKREEWRHGRLEDLHKASVEFAGQNEKDMVSYEGRILTAREALLTVQIETGKLEKESLDYQKEKAALQEKEAAAAAKKLEQERKSIEAAKKQRDQLMRGYVYGKNGEILREMTDLEKAQVRRLEIEA